MVKKVAKIDAHIQKPADFAKPILTHLQKVIHTARPDVQEKIKWRFRKQLQLKRSATQLFK